METHDSANALLRAIGRCTHVSHYLSSKLSTKRCYITVGLNTGLRIEINDISRKYWFRVVRPELKRLAEQWDYEFVVRQTNTGKLIRMVPKKEKDYGYGNFEIDAASFKVL